MNKPTLYTRQGRAVTAYHEDTKGRPYTVEQRPCSRCGGAGGGEQWRYTGYTCYQCAGNGQGRQEVLKLYTAEKLAKLNAAAEKKAAAKRTAADTARAREAEIAAQRLQLAKADYGHRFPGLLDALAAAAAATTEDRAPGFLADLHAKLQRFGYLSEAQLSAAAEAVARAKVRAEQISRGQHVGRTGERLETAVTVERVRSYERPKFHGYGYGNNTEIARVYGFRDAAGNALVAFARDLGLTEGQQVTIRGTVKQHGEYQGEPQTTLARVTVQERP